MNSSIREILKDKKRIVIKIGSSSLTHPETGALNLTKLEVLVREISDLRNMGKDVVMVSSGAIAVGRRAAGLGHRPSETKEKQACAAIGQARLMMVYQRLFAEYNQVAAQVRALVDGVAAGPGKFDIRSFGGAAIGGDQQLPIRLFRVANIVNGRL